MLALAYHVDALIEDGKLPDYATAARRLGLTRARMTQIMNLLQLAPAVQEGLLLGTMSYSERQLRAALCAEDWAAHHNRTSCGERPSYRDSSLTSCTEAS
jgi:hypothetical protein